MAINVLLTKQYNDRFLPDNSLLLTQALFHIFVWFDSTILLSYILTTVTLFTMYYSVLRFVTFGGSAWRLI